MHRSRQRCILLSLFKADQRLGVNLDNGLGDSVDTKDTVDRLSMDEVAGSAKQIITVPTSPSHFV